MRSLHRLGSLGLVLAALAAPVRAEDPPASDDLAARLIDVGALTLGLTDFVPEQTGDLVGPDAMSDAANPLFGAEGEEPIWPVGTIDELIEFLRSEVAPETWDAISGAGLRATGDTIVVRSRPDVVEEVGRVVQTLEERYLLPVTVEVQAVQREAADPAPPATLDAAAATALFTAPGARLSASLTGSAGQRANAFVGTQVAYVGDYDVEVAEKARIADPIVLVQNFGLSVSVRPVPSADRRRALLGLQVRLGRLQEMGTTPVEGGGVLEQPRAEVARIRAVVDVPVGTWQRVDGASVRSGAGGWAFYVRATVGALPPAGASPAPTPIPTGDVKGTGRFEVRTLDVGVLGEIVSDVVGELPSLVPSNYTPPEPPSLPEPRPIFPAESLADLLREFVAPGVWDRGGSIEVRRSWLRLRAPVAVLDACERLVAACRRHFLWSVEVAGESVSVPEALAIALLADAPEGRTLSPGARARLDAALASGEATLRDRVLVSSLKGARNSVSAGERRAYVADFDVEVATDAVIANPIVQTLFEGSVLDVTPRLLSADGGVLVEVRSTLQSATEPLRRAATPHGDLTVPTLSVSRLRTTAVLPLDRTSVVGSFGEGGRRTLVLLTPRRTRAE